MPKKGTKRSGFRKLRKTMKGGNRAHLDREGEPQPTGRITGRRSPTNTLLTIGVMVVAFIILNFMERNGVNFSGGNGSIAHSPTNMLTKLPHNFLNSKGQLNVREVLSGANVPENIIDKVIKEYPNIDTGNETVKEILERALESRNYRNLLADAKNKAEKIMRKSKSRGQ